MWIKKNFTLDFEEDLESYINKQWPKTKKIRIISKSLDARKANKGKRPSYHYVVEISSKNEIKEMTEKKIKIKFSEKPIIIGAGPAGLFCALRLLEKGITSIIIERGRPANDRMKDIAKFWRYGLINEESNVCYGEGGAGLFSDGKLITRIKSPHIKYVMSSLVQFGAPKETEYQANPHLGSNKIRGIISSLTHYLKSSGCEIHYNSKVEEILKKDQLAYGVLLHNGKELHSNHIVLATGHSARSMYDHLIKLGLEMEVKDFSVGVRVEHRREYINKIQFGPYFENKSLGTARYKLTYHNKENDRGTYSFCMCPGGYVLSSGTKQNEIVVNGMSNYRQNSPWSNSAIVSTVKTQTDLSKFTVTESINYQKKIEQEAYNMSKNLSDGRNIPSLTLDEFLNEKINDSKLPHNSCPSGVVKAPIFELFSKNLLKELQDGFLQFDKNLKGYLLKNALVLAPETRTSSPVKIKRDKELLMSTNLKGLYPCGEGAGFAGGITSSAVDGVKVADCIFNSLADNNLSQ